MEQITPALRARLKADILKERAAARKKRRLILWVSVLVMGIAIGVVEPVYAKYIYNLTLVEPEGLDAITHTDLLEALYPPGSIYMATENENPCITYGVGTWEALAPGKCLVGAGGGYSAGAEYSGGNTTRNISLNGTASGITGSLTLSGTATGVGANQVITGNASGVGGAISVSASKSLENANLPSHTHSIPNHNHSIASHTHTYIWLTDRSGQPKNGNSHNDRVQTQLWAGAAAYYVTKNNMSNPVSNSTTGGSSVADTNNSTGAGSPFTVNSSGSASGLAGTATFNLGTGGLSGSATVSGSVNLSGSAAVSGTGITDNVMQPYAVVYMWKRIS